MQISEVMHKDIKFANINDSVKKVAEMMKSDDIGSVPVMDGNKPVGIVTDRDIVIKCVADGADLNASIKSAMTTDVVCIKQSQSLEEASKLMAQRQISRVVVVDDSDKPVGIVSLHDLTQEDEDLAEETVNRIKQ
ncbi:MAG: CBS domain-containing protein [Bacteriovoracaceae bacterium]